MKKLLPLLLGCLVLTGCAKTESATVFSMNTWVSLTVHAQNPSGFIAQATAELGRLERLFSRTLPQSEVSALNEAQGQEVSLSPETLSLLRAAKEGYETTGGLFDVTIAPAASAWGFTESAYRVPSEAELEQLRPLVDGSTLAISDTAASLRPGQQIDLGGIAKGYASDRLADLFFQEKVENGFASLGGNVVARGVKEDGTPWRVGVKDPQDTQALCAVLPLSDAYAVTSGGYERCFTENGVTYHHILDPRTLRPAESDLLSATVVMPLSQESLSGDYGSGTLCDLLSTTLFILGEEGATAFWRSGVYDFDMVLITEDGRMVSTSGISLEPMEGSGYIYETIS